MLPGPGDQEQLEEAARRTADEGVARARELGIAAEPVTLSDGSSDGIARMLVRIAEEREATAIVVGRRGISRLEAVVLGSVSNATVREARCPGARGAGSGR